MDLWTWRTAQAMVEATSGSEPHNLPTTYQLSLLVGICLASVDRLRRWTSYRSFREQRKRAPRSPDVLVHAGLVLYLWLFMGCLMLAADTSVHYTTETIEYHQVSQSTNMQEFGRGLSQTCLNLDRMENYGKACSMNNLESNEDYQRERNEMLYLRHNTSTSSEIRLVEGNPDLIAILLPKSDNLSHFTDFRTSTMGFSTQCKPITHLCNFYSWGPGGLYSGFSCSSNFWGNLGKRDNETSSSDMPPLATKLGSSFL